MKNRENELPSTPPPPPPPPSPKSTSVIRTRVVTSSPKTIRIDLKVYKCGTNDVVYAVDQIVESKLELKKRGEDYELTIGDWGLSFTSNIHRREFDKMKTCSDNYPSNYRSCGKEDVWDYTNDDILYMYEDLQKAFHLGKRIVKLRFATKVNKMERFEIIFPLL